MRKLMLTLSLSFLALTQTACQTTKPSAPSPAINTPVICTILNKVDPLQYLSPDDKLLARTKFSQGGKDGQKAALAAKKEYGCIPTA